MTRPTHLMGAAGVIGVLGGLLAAGVAISGCGSGSGSAQNDATTTRLVASWRLAGVSGGITGAGYPVPPEGETLTFNRNGTFTRTVSRQNISGRYRVTTRKNALREGEMPVITYTSTTQTEVIYRLDAQSLILIEEAADGYSREYLRVAP